jgi:transcriptional regulator with XRE-family HTH domain
MDKPTLTPDQVVAYNLRRARELHGWTQDEAAERLEPFLGERWSRVVFSAAERSVTSGRVRQFNASQLVAFAAAFDLPVSFFLMPPREIESVAAKGATEGLTPERLIELAIAPQDDRLQELIEGRIRDTYRLATRGAPSAMPEVQAQMDAQTRSQRATRRATQRARAAAIRTAQKKGGKS